MDGYAHPYRRWIPVAWDYERVPLWVLASALVALGGLVADWKTESSDGELLALALVAPFMALVWTAMVTFNAALTISRRTGDWEESGHELAAVRRRRPHAGEADPELVHAEYAVAIDDAGQLVTYRFRPLAANEDAPAGGQLITGKPRYDAIAVAQKPFDPVDAALAAEQLADAQAKAAALEQDAIERAQRGLEAARTAAELEAESRGTAAALRSITGQSKG